jgi:hypothetical protein
MFCKIKYLCIYSKLKSEKGDEKSFISKFVFQLNRANSMMPTKKSFKSIFNHIRAIFLFASHKKSRSKNSI